MGLESLEGIQSPANEESSDWVVSPTGFEPVAPRLGISCSILLSYGDVESPDTLSVVLRQSRRHCLAPHCAQLRPDERGPSSTACSQQLPLHLWLEGLNLIPADARLGELPRALDLDLGASSLVSSEARDCPAQGDVRLCGCLAGGPRISLSTATRTARTDSLLQSNQDVLSPKDPSEDTSAHPRPVMS